MTIGKLNYGFNGSFAAFNACKWANLFYGIIRFFPETEIECHLIFPRLQGWAAKLLLARWGSWYV
jgi:hypothetical protein